MEIVYKVCCGIDVHKKFLVATIVITYNGIKAKYIKKRFSTFNKGIRELKAWLLENNCRDVCMESTGKYWVPVYNILEGEINVTITNPKWVKAVSGNKDDTKDSKWIADLFRIGLVPGSYIPDKSIRILRGYTRYRYKLTCNRSSERNRYQNSLTVCNVALASVVTDICGKSATEIVDYLLQLPDNTYSREEIVARLHGRLKSKEDLVIESIDGFEMDNAQKDRMCLIHDHMDYITSMIDELDAMLDTLVQPYEKGISLLCTIPGVDRNSAITIISEIGTDMSKFSTSKRLCSWAGLAPGSNASAGKKKSVRITRAGVYLKPALVQCAHAAVKSNASPYYQKKYNRLVKRRGKKRAIIAIARMILTAIYHMLTTGEVWNPTDLYKIDIPEHLQEKQKEKAIRQAMKLLVREGILQEPLPA